MSEPKKVNAILSEMEDDDLNIVEVDFDPVDDILSSAGAWSDIEDEFFERLEEANQESVRDLWS